MPVITGIYGVRWWTSATCLRILDRLACHGPASPDALAAALHGQEKYIYRLLRVTLRAAERVHVVGWQHNLRGSCTPVYGIGPGRDKRAPAAESPAQRAKRRRAALLEKYGTAITEKLLNPGKYGFPRIYVDGQRVRTSDHQTQLAMNNN